MCFRWELFWLFLRVLLLVVSWVIVVVLSARFKQLTKRFHRHIYCQLYAN